ncbi:glycosyltransferase family 2 protein [Clostridiaceae bacterium]|nr:glycosyltransferase family 2 protein [Clostridiaceae bacterium]
MLLSICLAVFNQIDLVKKNIQEILKSDSKEIEIVVSDDCSSDPIYEMLQSFNDKRIRYCKTSENKSHDENILNGLENCRGDYIFLFRSKDKIISEKVNDIIAVIKKYPNASYFLFSALDEERKERLILKDKIYHRYKEAQLAHGWLMVHPSGQIYKRSLLKIDLYRNYIETYFPTYNGCDVHQLIRMDLALNGDFVTSSCFAWEYMHTYRSTDKSVITTVKKLNIYAPYYQYQRYQCEWDFVINNVPKIYKKIYLKQIIKSYGWRIIPMFYLLNFDKDCNHHYNSESIEFNPYKELNIFKNKTLRMINDLDCYNNEIKSYLFMLIYKTAFYYIPKTVCKRFIYGHNTLKKMWFMIHKNKPDKSGLVT